MAPCVLCVCLFIFVRFELLIPCSTCKWCTVLHTAIRTALQSQHISSVDACRMLLSVVVVFFFFLCIWDPILCYLSLFHFITDSFMLFFTYLCSFLFSTIDLAFLFDKRICIGISARNLWYAWTSFVLNFICLYTVYSIQYAFSVLVLNVLSPVSRLYVCFFIFLWL